MKKFLLFVTALAAQAAIAQTSCGTAFPSWMLCNNSTQTLYVPNLALTGGVTYPAGEYVVTINASGALSYTAYTPSAGPQGPQGPAGPTGATGPKGATGAAGATGPKGAQGVQGLPGIAGAQGPQGLTGAVGPIGPAGPVGTQGATGPQGIAGPQGLPGADGAVGPMGPQGPAGPAGASGGFPPLYPGHISFPPQTIAAFGYTCQGFNVPTTVTDGIYEINATGRPFSKSLIAEPGFLYNPGTISYCLYNASPNAVTFTTSQFYTVIAIPTSSLTAIQ